MSAADIAAKVRTGELSAAAVVEEHLAAIDAREADIHAFNTEQCCDIMTVSRLDDQCSISDSIYLNLS